MKKRLNYLWYVKTDLRKYAGKWIAIADRKVVASGDDAEKVYKNAKKFVKNPALAKVPKKDTLILVILGC